MCTLSELRELRLFDPIDKHCGYLDDQSADYPCDHIEQIYLLSLLAELCREQNTRVTTFVEGFLSGAGRYLFLPAIQWLRSNNYDFGTAYSIASTVFVKVSLNDQITPEVSAMNFMGEVLGAVKKEQEKRDDFHIRQDHAGIEAVHAPYKTLPRRIWDVRSNRVIPFAFLTIKSIQLNPNSGAWVIKFLDSEHDVPPEFWAVSHSWAQDRKLVYTRVNHKKWPVPLPQQISLPQVRRELLCFGAKYVWLDILCLRQTFAGAHAAIDNDLMIKREQKREQEWKLDVPTIGNIYRIAVTIVRYFNGLGCDFSSQNWDDHRHWLQRAWTLQEIRPEDITYNGGVPESTNLWNSRGIFGGNEMTLRQAMEPLWELARHLDIDQEKSHGEIYRLVKEMRRRHASSDLDKLSGIFYLLRTTLLPTYSEGTLPSEAWEKCFHVLASQAQLELFFEFPYAGGDGRWFPSWSQLLSWPDRNPSLRHRTREAVLNIQHKQVPGCCHYVSNHWGLLLLEHIYILPNVTIQRSTEAKGEYVIQTSKIAKGNRAGRTRLVPSKRVSFQSVYVDQIEIPHGMYFLVTPQPSILYNWVVCEQFLGWTGSSPNFCPGQCIRKLQAQMFRKVGVLRTEFVISLTGPDSTLEKRSKCLFI